MKAIRKITENDYLDLAQNGARKLFDLGYFRVLDGTKGDEDSYFLVDFATEQWYLLDLKTAYELLARYYCGGDKQFLYSDIMEIITDCCS